MKRTKIVTPNGLTDLFERVPSFTRPPKTSFKSRRLTTSLSLAGAALLVMCSSVATACAIEQSFAALSSKEAAAKLRSDFQLQCELRTGFLICNDDEQATIVSLDFSNGHLSQLLITGPLKPALKTQSVFSIAKSFFTVPADVKSSGNERLRTDFFDPELRENIEISTPSCPLSRRHRNNSVIFIFVVIPKN
jgi:hypothetical protein